MSNFNTRALGRMMKVAPRRNLAGKALRPETDLIDGKIFEFRAGWTQDENDPYPGEIAYIPTGNDYPRGAPVWVSEGDLIKVPK